MTSMNKPSTGAIPEDPMERMIVTLSGMSSAERKRCKARSIKFPTKVCLRHWVLVSHSVIYTVVLVPLLD